jgi:transaldolase/glucose-6-phosphate isomerase
LEQPEDAVELGLLLGEAVQAGRDKLTFLSDPELEPFLPWLEQLIAESTGKQETGLVPVFGEPEGAHLGPDRIFVRLALDAATEDSLAVDRALLAAGHPLVRLEWPGVEAVGGEMMRWEIAAAAAGAVLKVQPFDQPDVDLAKRLARQAMEGEATAEPDDPEIVDSSDGEALQVAMGQWLEGAAPGDYIAIQAFLPPAEEVQATVAGLRANLATTGLPTTLGFGPRFLHSTGQLHKGGRPGVFCLQLIDSGGPDLAVPETDHSFRRLIDAQALGDARALAQRGRRVLRVRLGDAQ